MKEGEGSVSFSPSLSSKWGSFKPPPSVTKIPPSWRGEEVLWGGDKYFCQGISKQDKLRGGIPECVPIIAQRNQDEEREVHPLLWVWMDPKQLITPLRV